MNGNRKAKKVLKQFGKETYQSRIQYINSFIDHEPVLIRRISYRHMMKRCAILALILMLSFALLVVTASAFGIHVLNFSFFEKSDHTEIVSNVEDDGLDDEVQFYKVTYVPEEYKLVSKESFIDSQFLYVYENEENEYLYIDQNLVEGYSIDVNNEDCTVRDELIGDIAVKIYDYGKRITCLFQYYDTFIRIEGAISDDELVKIIDGLGLQ